MATVGFIGLGQMGAAMATNLINGGNSLNVYDINKDAMSKLASLGAKACETLSDVAKDADFVITMLPNGALVRDVLLGADNMVDHLPKDALVIDMSTIHPLETDALIADLAKHGIEMMEAPVGRTSDHAIAGTLLVLAGGTKEQIAKAQPLFDLMGSETVDAGGPGKGIRVKIINNFMSIALNALSAEAITLAEKIGLDFETAMSVMSGTPAGKGHFTTSWPNKVLKGDLTPAFMIDLAHKDLGIALDLANQVGVPMPMGAASRELYNMSRIDGRGQQDWTAVLAELRALSGMKAAS